MQIFQMNVEHCTLHGRQKLSQNLLDVIQVDSFQGLSDPVQLFSRHIFSQFSACIGCELLVMFDWYFGDQTIMCYGKPLFEMCWFYKGISQIALDPPTEQTFSSSALLLIKYFPLFPSLGPNVQIFKIFQNFLALRLKSRKAKSVFKNLFADLSCPCYTKFSFSFTL